jgi:hypothetical protein
MANKLIKIFILSCFLTPSACFSQVKQSDFKNEDVLTQYNNYLAAVHLKQLIKAANFSYNKEISYKGSLGAVNLTGVHVLTIEPDSAFNDPLQFALSWNNALEILNGKASAYYQLFFKLTDYAHLPPDSLVILIKTRKPNIISYLVYFDNGIKVNEPVIEIRGDPEKKINITPIDPSFDDYFEKQPFTPGLAKKLIDSTSTFLKRTNKHKVDQKIHVEVENHNDHFIIFTATNIKGWLTNNYYEVIVIRLSIAPAQDQKLADFNWYFSVGYASGYSAPSNFKNYEDAAKSYYIEMDSFRRALRTLIHNTIWSK